MVRGTALAGQGRAGSGVGVRSAIKARGVAGSGSAWPGEAWFGGGVRSAN